MWKSPDLDYAEYSKQATKVLAILEHSHKNWSVCKAYDTAVTYRTIMVIQVKINMAVWYFSQSEASVWIIVQLGGRPWTSLFPITSNVYIHWRQPSKPNKLYNIFSTCLRFHQIHSILRRCILNSEGAQVIQLFSRLYTVPQKSKFPPRNRSKISPKW